MKYAEDRKAVEFEPTDSARDKALYVCRLLVHDKVIAPMPEDQVSDKTVRHRLATWFAHHRRVTGCSSEQSTIKDYSEGPSAIGSRTVSLNSSSSIGAKICSIGSPATEPFGWRS